MADGPIAPASSKDEDVAQQYSQSPWWGGVSGDNNIYGAANSGPLSYVPLTSSPDLMPNRYGPGLLGDVRAFRPTAIDNQPDSGLSDYQTGGAYPFASNLYSDALARPDDDGGIMWIGNPANRRLRRESSQKSGLPWPKDPVTGRNYDVAHIVAKADGGKDHVDNIRPMHPNDHMAEHVANGDFSRWAKRAGTAGAFGGKVARAVEPLAVINGLLGLLSGRIRTNNFSNFTSDMMGFPSPEDEQKAFEARQRLFNPNWKPGDPYST